jgi:hypothetical protein
MSPLSFNSSAHPVGDAAMARQSTHSTAATSRKKESGDVSPHSKAVAAYPGRVTNPTSALGYGSAPTADGFCIIAYSTMLMAILTASSCV